MGWEDRFRSGRLISGFDFYYWTPPHNRLPFHTYLDPIVLAFAFPSPPTCAENLADARSLGFRIEVSEGQAETYPGLTAPGNSARHFRFMLLRCASKVLDPAQPSVLRIWGIEAMAQKALGRRLTPEHEQIFDLIQRLNESHPPQIRKT